MEGQGWVRPEPARPESGGFVTTDTRGVFRGWCGPEHMATVSTAGSDLGTFVRVSIRPIRQTPCDPEMAARLVTRGIPRTSLEIPALAPPDGGVEVSFGGGGSSDDYAESEARITGPIAADGLLDHYGAQLEALGWLAGDRLGATDASVGRWTGEVDGEPAIAMLNFIRLDGDVTRGSLRIQLADSARWR